MSKSYLSFFPAFLLVVLNQVNAQNENTFRVDSIDYNKVVVSTTLSGDDLEAFSEEVINTVVHFNNNLAKLWAQRNAKEYSVAEYESFRKKIKAETLDLFIGRGESYYSEDTVAFKIEGHENGRPYYVANDKRIFTSNVREDERGVLRAYVFDSVLHPGPVMEVTSTNRNGKSRKPMNRYVNTIMPRLGVTVKATFGGYRLMDNFYMERPGVYVGSVSYYQEYRSYYSEGRKGYSDCTYKTMKVYILLDEVQIGSQKYKTWKILLGDVEAIETHRI